METETKDDNTVSDGTSLLANQCVAVPQKRQKKSSAPVLQRIRPISKRKKFKKSLGPDFIESAELGMQYLRDTYEPKCDICSLTVSSSNSINGLEELLHCTHCDAKAHPSCVNLNEEEVVHKTQWQCHNCKLCSVCGQTDANEYVIICMTCSKGFHVKCHSTTIVNKPKGNWYCHSCCSKKSSNSSQHTNGVTEKKTILYASDDSSQSEENDNTVAARDDKNFNLFIDNDSNCDTNDKDKEEVVSQASSTSSKDLPICKTFNEEADDNQNGSLCENMEITNGIHLTKDDNTEEANAMDYAPDSGDYNQTSESSISPQKWSVEEVESFIRDAGFPTESQIFKEQEIDGRSLLLLRRMDVLTGLSLKLGPALKIYNHISRLQGRQLSHSSPPQLKAYESIHQTTTPNDSTK